MQIRISTLLWIAAALFLAACSTTSKTVAVKESQVQKIQKAYNEKNYALVLQLVEKMETAGTVGETDRAILEMAGISAFITGNWDKTHHYLTAALDTTSNAETIGILGTSYQNSGNQTLEYQHWNRYLDQLEGSPIYQTATTRLFELGMEMQQYEAALKVWDRIPAKEDAGLKYDYLTLLEKSGQTSKALQYSQEILEQHPNHEATLYWRARYYFDKAEKLYQSEMEKYNRKPDYTSYAYLRRELKKASADYRAARDLLEQLHKMNPHHLNYIRYLKNCYLRLEMKTEAEQMDQLLNEPLKK